ncbi:MAG: helix-turn-helix transcriptional regulator [Isosphaeraceae bacterium]
MRIRNTTRNLEQSCDDMRQFWPDCRVSYSGRGAYFSSVNGLLLAESSFSDNATVRGLRVEGLVFPDCHLISIPISGHSSHVVKGRQFQVGRSKAILQPAGESISAWPLSHVRTFQVTIQTSALERFISSYVGPEKQSLATIHPEILLTGPHGQVISELGQRMTTWLNSDRFEIESAGRLMRAFELRFIQAIVEEQAQHWNFLEQSPAAEPFYIGLAEEMMRNSVQAGMDFAELALACGVSGRSLQLGFRKYRGYSPSQFFKNLRLEAVHESLKNGENTAPISKIAIDFGFHHAGRFALEYQRKFHELPTQNRQKATRREDF